MAVGQQADIPERPLARKGAVRGVSTRPVGYAVTFGP